MTQHLPETGRRTIVPCAQTLPELIHPDWSAPATVFAVSTTRAGGVSQPPFDSFNLAAHVGDAPAAVAENRRRLAQILDLPGMPVWLNQEHGSRCIYPGIDSASQADAACTDQPGVVCAVLTADCLPLLLCDRDGHAVAAVHAGWRGLAAGVIEATLEAMPVRASGVLAWMGPAIGASMFEVGRDVRDRFLHDDQGAANAFTASGEGKWLADLYQLARLRLQRLGVYAIHGGNWCTHSDTGRFFSYRRDRNTGRMATLIWLAAAGDSGTRAGSPPAT